MEFKLKRFEKVIEVSRIANIHYFEFTNQYHTSKDNHAFNELIYVDNGSIIVDAENYSGKLIKNQMIIHKPYESHSLTCIDDNAPNVIIIGFECKSEELNVFSRTPVTLSQELQNILTEIIKEGRTVFLPPYDLPNLRDMKKRRDYTFGADQMIKLQLEMFLIRLIRDSKVNTGNNVTTAADGSKIFGVFDYINENFRENITLNELCFLFRTNKTTLCSEFKKTYGDTIIDYINRKKIKEAKILLREGKYNFTEIASMLGFNSIHYFSRLFKKYEHQSPASYINTIKAKLNL